MNLCALSGCLASLVSAMVSKKLKAPLLGSRASITSVEPFSLARPAAMLMSPAQPTTAQALPPATSSIMVALNRRMSLRTLPSISVAAL